MRYLIIEPHADDAMLSGYYCLDRFILNKNNVYLSTITTSTPTGQFRDSQQYCKYRGWCFVPDNNYIPQIFFMECTSKLAKIRNRNYYNIEETFYIYNYLYPEIYTLIKKRIEKLVNEINPKIVITNYGVLHATHVFTRKAVDEVCSKYCDIYYMIDNPYAYENNIIEQIINRYSTIVNYTLTEKEKIEKEEKFKMFYPSEIYMKSTYPYIYENTEILL